MNFPPIVRSSIYSSLLTTLRASCTNYGSTSLRILCISALFGSLSILHNSKALIGFLFYSHSSIIFYQRIIKNNIFIAIMYYIFYDLLTDAHCFNSRILKILSSIYFFGKYETVKNNPKYLKSF